MSCSWLAERASDLEFYARAAVEKTNKCISLNTHWKIFWYFLFIYHVNVDCLFTNAKKKHSKIPSKSEKSLILLSMHKVGMGPISIHVSVQNMLILNQKVIFYIMFSYLFVSVQRTEQRSFKIFLQTRIMVVGAKLNSQDSGTNFWKYTFKMTAARKIQICLLPSWSCK